MVTLPRAFWEEVVKRVIGPALDADRPIAEQRRRIALATRVLPSARGVRISAAGPDEPAGEWHRPPGVGPQRAILYLHGGGFVLGSPRTHRPLASALAVAARTQVFVLDYRLAPEHPFPAAIDDTLAAWRWLRGRVPDSGRLALAGDSAGGNLALGAALAAADEGLPAAALCLFSPWVDLSLASSAAAGADIMLSESWLRASARLYLNGADARNARISPLRADLASLPPTLVQYTDRERLSEEIGALCRAARGSGVDITVALRPGLWHGWHGLGTALGEARDALTQAGRFLDERMADR